MIELLGSPPQRIHIFYSLAKSPEGLRTLDADVNCVYIRDWMTLEACKGNASKKVRGEYLKSHQWVPVGSHCHPIGFAIFGQSMSILVMNQLKHWRKTAFESFLPVEEFECPWDEAEEGINDPGVHVYDIIV